MTVARSVSATFSQNAPSNYTLSVVIAGSGNVTSSPTGINCSTPCNSTFASGTPSILPPPPEAATASPDHAKTATSANNDGVIQLWVDDVLTLNNTNLPLYPLNGAGNYFRNGYLMGWSNSGFDQTSNTYIDDITISDAFIGGNPLRAPVAQ